MFDHISRRRRAAFAARSSLAFAALITITGCPAPIPGPVTPTTPEVLEARIWVSRGKEYYFAEHDHGTRPTTGVCLSGGGTRALSAGMGQLRALNQLGLLKNVQYLSCVSGGAWLGTMFTYYNRGAANDSEFLGPVTPPEAITWPGLQHLPMSRAGHTATKYFAGAIWELLEGGYTHKDLIWIQAVGETFLEPFGLYDDCDPGSVYFSLDLETVRDIKTRNPSLRHKRFHTVRNNDTDVKRPYLIVNSTLIWPVGHGPAEKLVGFEYTPLYAGNPYRLDITYKPYFKPTIRRTVGGGFIEPFAYGCYAPTSPAADGFVRVTQPPAFSLADAAGTSSSAYARILGEVNGALLPLDLGWPATGAGGELTYPYDFGDGGNLENYGLMPMLLRKVKNVVVFINTPVKLNVDYKPSPDNPPSASDIDDVLPAYFGLPVRSGLLRKRPYPNNQVFKEEDFQRVVEALQSAQRSGRGGVAVTDLEVQSNDWWGVPGNWTTRICWVYLDRAAAWESQLYDGVAPRTGRTLAQAINEGNDPYFPSGPFQQFPNYRTAAENFPDLIELTKQQVNLLADLTCWVVMENHHQLQQVLGPDRLE